MLWRPCLSFSLGFSPKFFLCCHCPGVFRDPFFKMQSTHLKIPAGPQDLASWVIALGTKLWIFLSNPSLSCSITTSANISPRPCAPALRLELLLDPETEWNPQPKTTQSQTQTTSPVQIQYMMEYAAGRRHSWNPRLLCVGKDFKAHPIPLPALSRETFPYPRLLRTLIFLKICSLPSFLPPSFSSQDSLPQSKPRFPSNGTNGCSPKHPSGRGCGVLQIFWSKIQLSEASKAAHPDLSASFSTWATLSYSHWVYYYWV